MSAQAVCYYIFLKKNNKKTNKNELHFNRTFPSLVVTHSLNQHNANNIALEIQLKYVNDAND